MSAHRPRGSHPGTAAGLAAARLRRIAAALAAITCTPAGHRAPGRTWPSCTWPARSSASALLRALRNEF